MPFLRAKTGADLFSTFFRIHGKLIDFYAVSSLPEALGSGLAPWWDFKTMSGGLEGLPNGNFFWPSKSWPVGLASGQII